MSGAGITLRTHIAACGVLGAYETEMEALLGASVEANAQKSWRAVLCSMAAWGEAKVA